MTPDALRAQVAELRDAVRELAELADLVANMAHTLTRITAQGRVQRDLRWIEEGAVTIAARLRAPEPTGEDEDFADVRRAQRMSADATRTVLDRLRTTPPAPAPEGETWRTCARCGLADANVLDLDTGAPCHPEWRHCVRALAQRLAAAPEGEERPMWGPHLAWRLMTRDELIAELQRLQDEARQPPFPQQALMDELNEELEAAEQRLAAYDALAGRAKDALVDDSAEHYNVVRDLAAMREG